MCIDTLEIGFTMRRRRGRRRQNSEFTDTNFINPELTDIHVRLAGAGYAVDEEIYTWGATGQKFNVRTSANEIGFTIKGRSTADQVFVTDITAHPMRYSRWSDFWDVLIAMDGRDLSSGEHRVIDQGYIKRIDYTLDLEIPIAAIMQGLYVDQAQTIVAFADLNHPYISEQWRRGYFASFQIGKEPKIIKIYDKSWEQQRRRAAQANSPDQLWPDEERPVRRPRAANRTPWTRIEIKTTGPANITDIMNSYRRVYQREADDIYTGHLRDLPLHIEDISRGITFPFRGVLLNFVQTRSPQFDKNLDAQKARHEVELGFFTNLFIRMTRDGNFWSDSRRFFTLYPWLPKFQPTALYRARLREWCSSGVRNRAVTLPDRRHGDEPLTDSWPIELTMPTLPARAVR